MERVIRGQVVWQFFCWFFSVLDEHIIGLQSFHATLSIFLKAFVDGCYDVCRWFPCYSPLNVAWLQVLVALCYPLSALWHFFQIPCVSCLANEPSVLSTTLSTQRKKEKYTTLQTQKQYCGFCSSGNEKNWSLILCFILSPDLLMKYGGTHEERNTSLIYFRCQNSWQKVYSCRTRLLPPTS